MKNILILLIIVMALSGCESFESSTFPIDLCENEILDTNNDESDIDCGGTSCAPCNLSDFCLENEDCSSLYCDEYFLCVESTCSDNIQNGHETGIDCGGFCGDCSEPNIELDKVSVSAWDEGELLIDLTFVNTGEGIADIPFTIEVIINTLEGKELGRKFMTVRDPMLSNGKASVIDTIAVSSYELEQDTYNIDIFVDVDNVYKEGYLLVDQITLS
jgi:hypothetical protein